MLLLLQFLGLDAARIQFDGGSSVTTFDELSYSAGELPAGSSPVIIVGPLMAQSLEVRADPGSAAANRLCPGRSKTYSTVWGSTSKTRLDPLCVETSFSLTWDNSSKVGRGSPGIHVRPQGGRRGFDALRKWFGMDLWGPMIDRLEGVGYEVGTSIIGHPYDWRQSVASWQRRSFPLLQTDIESAVTMAKSRAVITALSMGCPYLHAFLRWAGEEWNAAHIEAFVPYGGPFNGATSALQTALGGFIKSFDTSGGTCPGCVPSMEARAASSTPQSRLPMGKSDDSLWGSFKGAVQKEAMSFLEGPLTSATHSFPSIYWMVPGVDSSVEPPEDPLVLKFPKGFPPPACRRAPDNLFTGTSCGAAKTIDGWTLQSGLLEPDQCGECAWHGRHYLNSSSPCPDEFEVASKSALSVLCCRLHRCKEEQFRASQLPELLRSMGRASDADMMAYALTQSTTDDPGVPVHCVIGLNSKTVEVLEMEGDMESISISFGDGDGTVHASSLQVCSRWKSTVKTYTMPSVRHGGSIVTEQSSDIIVAVATGDTAAWQAWMAPEKFDIPDALLPSVDSFVSPPSMQLVQL